MKLTAIVGTILMLALCTASVSALTTHNGNIGLSTRRMMMVRLQQHTENPLQPFQSRESFLL